MYITSLLLEINHSRSATITVTNSLLITLPFYGFPLLLDQLFGFPVPIYIWSWRGYLLVSHSIKYYIYSFINLAVFEIFLPSIFQYWINLYSWIKKDNIHFRSMSCLAFILLVIFLLSSTLRKYVTNIANTGIQLSS